MKTYGLDMLIFGAHPDDAEIGMGATIYKHTKAGFRVGICDLTFAEMSSNGTVESRRIEADEAGRILGLAERSNLGLPDRGLRFESDQLTAIVQEIRRLRPRYVFAPYGQDRHPDHVQCGKMVEDAVFSAKLRKYLPDSEPFQVERLYSYFINDVYEPDIVIDVTADYSKKIEALQAYRSQFYVGEGDVVTAINQGFLDGIEARDKAIGQKLGYRFAEGFVCKQPIVMDVFS